MTKAQAGAYLAGMIDGEGHVRVRTNRSVSVSSTDWDLIQAVVMCCERLGLRYRIADIKARPEKNKRAAWELYMHGKDTLMTIQRCVPIQSGRKQAALAEAIGAYKYKRRPPREWVEQKYIVEGLSLQEMAEAWGVKNSVSAHCWMKFYGIPRRSLSDANTLRYQKART